MPLLERGELLQRQRVDPAQQRQRALGGPQPLLLLPRARTARLGATASPRRPRRAPSRARPDGDRRCGPYSSTSTVGSTPSSSIALASSVSMRSRCWVRATSSRCTLSVSSRSSSASSASPRARTASSPSRAVRSLARRRALGPPGGAPESTSPAAYAARDPHRPAISRLGAAVARAAGPAARGRPARPRPPAPAAGPGAARPAPAPRRCAGDSRASVSAARAAGRPGPSSLALGRGLGVARRLLRRGQPLLQLGERASSVLRASCGLGQRPAGPVGLGVRGPDGGAELAQLLGDCRQPGVGVVQPVQRVLDASRAVASRSRAPASANRACSTRRSAAATASCSASSRAAWTSSRLGAEGEPPWARPTASTSPSAVTAVTSGSRSHQVPGRVEVGDDCHPVEQPVESGPDRRRGLDEIGGPARAGGQLRPLAAVGARPVAGDPDEEPGPAGVVGTQQPQRGDAAGRGSRPPPRPRPCRGRRRPPPRPRRRPGRARRPSRAARSRGRWRPAAPPRRPCGPGRP